MRLERPPHTPRSRRIAFPAVAEAGKRLSNPPGIHTPSRIPFHENPMAKKRAKPKTQPAPRIVLRTGEALVEAEPAWSAAEPEVVIGELDGPVGYAIANLIGNQVKGHSRVFALLNCDVQVRPVTVMVSKVTVNNAKYTNILMGTVQAAIAHGVLDAVRDGELPKAKVNDLGIIVSVWLDPSVVEHEFDADILFHTHRAATTKAIHKAMNDEPGIDWLLANQYKVTHFFHQMALDGTL
jgi:5,6,7,8-tetrahydromethanopterin hydro-lyase